MLKWAYILIGNDKTGKTTFQKEIVKIVSHKNYNKLTCNISLPITVRIGSNNSKTISIMNRSFQEKKPQYQTVENFFSSEFKDTDIAILSSHIDESDIKQMLVELRKRFFNVGGVFFQNSITLDKQLNENISLFPWDERYFIENPPVNDEDLSWQDFISQGALEFSHHILHKF